MTESFKYFELSSLLQPESARPVFQVNVLNILNDYFGEDRSVLPLRLHHLQSFWRTTFWTKHDFYLRVLSRLNDVLADYSSRYLFWSFEYSTILSTIWMDVFPCASLIVSLSIIMDSNNDDVDSWRCNELSLFQIDSLSSLITKRLYPNKLIQIITELVGSDVTVKNQNKLFYFTLWWNTIWLVIYLEDVLFTVYFFDTWYRNQKTL